MQAPRRGAVPNCREIDALPPFRVRLIWRCKGAAFLHPLQGAHGQVHRRCTSASTSKIVMQPGVHRSEAASSPASTENPDTGVTGRSEGIPLRPLARITSTEFQRTLELEFHLDHWRASRSDLAQIRSATKLDLKSDFDQVAHRSGAISHRPILGRENLARQERFARFTAQAKFLSWRTGKHAKRTFSN